MQKNLCTKGIHFIGNIFVGLAVFVVMVVLLSFLLPQFHYGIAIIKSGSMTPTLGVGSIAVLAEKDTYQDGQIITFTRPGNQVITHRIIEVLGAGDSVRYRVQGDVNNAPDATLVEHEHVLGKVLFGIPLIGHIALFARTPIGFIALIIIPGLWIVTEEGLKIKKALRERKNKDNNDTV